MEGRARFAARVARDGTDRGVADILGVHALIVPHVQLASTCKTVEVPLLAGVLPVSHAPAGSTTRGVGAHRQGHARPVTRVELDSTRLVVVELQLVLALIVRRARRDSMCKAAQEHPLACVQRVLYAPAGSTTQDVAVRQVEHAPPASAVLDSTRQAVEGFPVAYALTVGHALLDNAWMGVAGSRLERALPWVPSRSGV